MLGAFPRPVPIAVAPPGSEQFYSSDITCLSKWPNFDDMGKTVNNKCSGNFLTLDLPKNVTEELADFSSLKKVRFFEEPVLVWTFAPETYIWLGKPLE